MNKASEALADVRGWLCDNLSEGDAGKVCGMLSVVSRHITELDNENAKLREIVRDMRKAFFALDIDHCQACPRDTINGPCTKYLISGSDECNFEEEMRELGIEVDA